MANIKTLYNDARKIVARIFYKSVKNIGNERKIVSFTFDDVPKSTFENAVPILSKFKLSGTFYVALSLMEGISGKDLYSRENLQKCIEDGHELGCHSYSHIHFFKTKNTDIIREDLIKNRNILEELRLNTSFESFSYPYGEQTIISKKVVSGMYKSCRGTDSGINYGKADLNSLRAVKLYEKKSSREDIDSLLDQFDHKGGWLIFYTHDVQENFSAGGCSPGYLEDVIMKCKELGFEIKNMKQAVASL
jgi:peptidoglycan/xylan/chitin deacetylase (PgdA/CDA1 family)